MKLNWKRNGMNSGEEVRKTLTEEKADGFLEAGDEAVKLRRRPTGWRASRRGRCDERN